MAEGLQIMKKSLKLFLFFCLFSTAIIIWSTNSHAENNIKFRSLLIEFGVSHVSHLNQKAISEISQNQVIKCWVIDPAKLDGFKKFEEVELRKLEGNKWELKSPITGNKVAFEIRYKDDGKIELIKIASYTSPEKLVSSSINAETGPAETGFYFGGGGSYAWENFDTDVFEDFGINVDIDDSWGLNAFAGYRIMRYLAVEGNFNWYDDFDAQALDVDFQIKIWTLMLDLKGMYPVYNDRLVPYLRLGGGYMDAEAEIGSNSEKEEDFGINLGAGIDYFATDQVSIGLDGKYVWGTGDLDELEYFVGTLNVAYHF
jgi:opacity protein-like surface antigen